MSYQHYRPSGFKVLPPVVKNLLILNGLFFFATVVLQDQMGIDLTNALGLHYFRSEHFAIYQFATYMFMHGGIGHIFFNMFALWMFGNVLENFWGGKRFLTYYVVTALGAAFIHMLFQHINFSSISAAIEAYQNSPSPEAFATVISDYFPAFEQNSLINGLILEWQNSPLSASLSNESVQVLNKLLELQMNIPTVGASGAVFGILLAFGMLFPNTLLYIYFAIPIKAKYFVIIYGCLELIMGFANRTGDNVAHFAHLGGMLFGFILIQYWKRNSNRFY